MAMYASVDDLVEELTEERALELCDDENSGSLAAAPVQARLSDSLVDASALVDSYAGGRYTVPLVPVPAIVSRYTTTIATYYCHLRRPNVPDSVQLAYDNAIAWLKDVAKGTVSLGETEEEPEVLPDAALEVRAVVTGPQVFTRESLANY
jgi:phage gp36-like protein